MLDQISSIVEGVRPRLRVLREFQMPFWAGFENGPKKYGWPSPLGIISVHLFASATLVLRSKYVATTANFAYLEFGYLEFLAISNIFAGNDLDFELNQTNFGYLEFRLSRIFLAVPQKFEIIMRN